MKFHGCGTLTVIALVMATCRAQDAPQLDWSAGSTSLPQFWDKDSKPVGVPAPNGKLTLRVVGKKTGSMYPEDEMIPDYFLEKAGRRLQPAIRLYASPFALWSTSSDLLAITSSDGGAVGNWRVYVYSVEGDAVVEHNVMRQVQEELARAFPAGINPPGHSFFSRRDREQFASDPSWVNVSAVRWIENPERLLILASVPPSSGYGANMGQRRGYVVEPITGRILLRCMETEFTNRDSACAIKSRK
jgi:hypothetical protein